MKIKIKFKTSMVIMLLQLKLNIKIISIYYGIKINKIKSNFTKGKAMNYLQKRIKHQNSNLVKKSMNNYHFKQSAINKSNSLCLTMKNKIKTFIKIKKKEDSFSLTFKINLRTIK